MQVLSVVDRVDPEGATAPQFEVQQLMGVQYVPLTPPSDSDDGDLDSDSLDEADPPQHLDGTATGVDGDAEDPRGPPRRHAWHAPTGPAPGATS